MGLGSTFRRITGGGLGNLAGLTTGGLATLGLLRSPGFNLGGGSAGRIAPATIGFNTSGLSGSFNRETGTYDVTRSPGLTGLIDDIRGRSDELSTSLGGLLSRVAPGMSNLRASRLQGLENRRRRAIGNLRDNLSRRRIAGSSFAQDAITRSEIAYEQEADRIRAESEMTELEATQQLLQQQAQAQLQGMNVALSQMNLESQIASNLATSASAAINSANQFNANLALQQEQGNMEALGNIAQLGTSLALGMGGA